MIPLLLTMCLQQGYNTTYYDQLYVNHVITPWTVTTYVGGVDIVDEQPIWQWWRHDSVTGIPHKENSHYVVRWREYSWFKGSIYHKCSAPIMFEQTTYVALFTLQSVRPTRPLTQ